jgi:5-methylcytosine-specific restriction protein B
MIAKEIQRDQLWQAVHAYIMLRPGITLRLYYKCSDGIYESLPISFDQNDYRLPRLLVEDKAIRKSKSLPEPFRKEFLKTAEKHQLLSLGLACSKYFGPLCRPDRANQTYNPYNELHFNLTEVQPIFPDVHTKFYYGKYIRFDQLAALYFDITTTETSALAEETPAYQPTQIFPLNIILYGPPGTGKTYHSVTYAVAIIEGTSIAQVEAEDRLEVRRRYEVYRENEQIEFITFHQSYAYEDFIQGLRPDANRINDGLHFKLVDGVLKRIADRAKTNYISYHQNKAQPELPFELLLDRLLVEKMNRVTEEVELPITDSQGQFKSIIIYEVGDTYLKYKRRSLRDIVKEEERLLYINKLKEKYYGKEIREAIHKIYYETVVNAVQKFEQQMKHADNNKELRNFVLIIDEINRANISRVFGELITLLEEDKRYGKENALSATLPSGEIFALSPNLYLVGTMNTADKSIALLDIALRRRFEFIGMYPRYDLIPDFAPLLQALNAKIQEKKGADFMIGHSFFIGKTEADLPAIFNQKIVPLLHEYFNNRLDQVKDVVKATGLEITELNYQLQVKSVQP